MKSRRMIKAAIGTVGVLAAVTTGTTVAQAAIPSGSTGSLTIHKYLQPVEYREGNQGMELPSSATQNLSPLAGAEYTIQQVPNIDLTNNQGWLDAAAAVETFDPFNPGGVLGVNANTPVKVQTTNSQGNAAFTSLPVGLYLVKETALPPVGANQQFTKAMPFLITVPLTEPGTRDKWVYDVHAYPKSVLSEVEKTVSDRATTAVGQDITYTISGTIPGGAVTEKYQFTDTLDSKLTFQKATVSVAGQATTDFTVEQTGKTVKITLGTSARQAAYTSLLADPSATVEATIRAKVDAAGEIDNNATVTYNRAGEVETEVPSNSVTTKFGGIQVLKLTKDRKPLSGATFEVHHANSSDFTKAKKVTAGGKSSWTTGSDGRLTIDGLRYSGFADGAAVPATSAKYNHYWLVETKAPAGYELLVDPVPFEVRSQVGSAPVLEIVNVPHNAGGELPRTGAGGSLAVMGGGFLIAGTAIVLMMRREPKTRHLPKL